MSSPTKPRVVKKILAAGRGSLPAFEKDDKAVLDYEVLVPKIEVKNGEFPTDRDDYTSIDNTKSAHPHGYGQPLELVFGKSFSWPILETCLQTMLVNEIAQFDLETRDVATFPLTAAKLRDIKKPHNHPRSGGGHRCAVMGTPNTGYNELDELLHNPRPARLIIHLKSFISAKDYTVDTWQLNDAQRLASVESLRLEGNRLFRDRQYEEAKEKYRESLTILDGLILKEKPNDPEWIELDQKNVPIYLNLCQCYLILGKYYEAIGAAEEALKRDPLNEKGLFRRAKARIGAWELDAAETDFKTLLTKHPDTTAIVTKELAALSIKRSEKLASDKNVYKAMFGKK